MRPNTRRDNPGDVPPESERCFCEIAVRNGSSIQRIAYFENGRCRKRGSVLLTSAGGPALFCATHARMALEGFVSAEGHVMPDTDRANARRYFREMPHAGAWATPATPETTAS